MKNDLKNKDLNPRLRKTDVSGSRFVPMLFSTEMVQAILNGTKTETRRILTKEDWLNKSHINKPTITDNGKMAHFGDFAGRVGKVSIGDIIWVRETFINQADAVYYKADNIETAKHYKWKPSLFMPKYACRIFLKCVSVNVERLQDIDEKSAINEGIIQNYDAKEGWYKNYLFKNPNIIMLPKKSYMTLWQKINGKNSWEVNPFVWVYKFERTERPHDFR